MKQDETPVGEPPPRPGWNAVVAAGLGIMLLAAGLADTRAYLAHRRRAQPDFALVEPPGGMRLEDAEAYRRGDTFVWLEHTGEMENSRGEWFRHGLGPRGVLRIWSSAPHATLDIVYDNAVEGQDLAVSCDGQTLEQFTRLEPGKLARSYPLALRPGMNEVTLTFARYNHAGVELARTDSRPLAGRFLKIDLTLR